MHVLDIISSTVDLGALVMLAIFGAVFVLLTLRAKGGDRIPLRPIPVYARIRQLVSEAAESGKPIHVGMGSGQIGREETPEAVMGLIVFDYVARQATLASGAVKGSTGDAATLAAAEGLFHQARWASRFAGLRAAEAIRFFGPDRYAYAAGASGALSREPHVASVLIGSFEAESLILSEADRGARVPQLGGTTDPVAAALMFVSLDQSVIGEEVFAAGAYLDRPSHLGSVAAQDLMRIVIIVSMLAGVAMASLGFWG